VKRALVLNQTKITSAVTQIDQALSLITLTLHLAGGESFISFSSFLIRILARLDSSWFFVLSIYGWVVELVELFPISNTFYTHYDNYTCK